MTVTDAAGAAQTTVAWSRSFPRAFLLLLIAESPAHGYDLLERLGGLGTPPLDAGTLYRSLRAMEHEGLVESSWEISAAGPARRVYRLRGRGRRALHDWAEQLAATRRLLTAYDQRYAALGRGPDGE